MTTAAEPIRVRLIAMMRTWRARLWEWARRNYPAGMVLPRRLIAVRAIPYPVEWLRWFVARSANGYDPTTDCWRIAGVKYPHALFERTALITPDGCWMRVIKVEDIGYGPTVTVEVRRGDLLTRP